MPSARFRLTVLVALAVALYVPSVVRAEANEAAAWAALRQGGHIALMRHADAPGGAGDPAGFRLDDCATQRNLSPTGRQRAAAVGARLRGGGIAATTLLTSPWCRCIDTARLLGIGPETVEPAFSNMFVLADQRTALTDAAGQIIRRWQGPGTLFVVTHGANILALTGRSPAEAEIVVVKASAAGSLDMVGHIPPAAP